MTYGKIAGIAAGFVCAFGIGVWTGTKVAHGPAHEAPAAASAAPASDTATAPVAPRPATRPRPAARAAAKADAPTEFTPMKANVPVSAPELQHRLKPVLKSGANMEVAAEGFNSAEQFATVAHASRNTDVPFMLLKHRVLDEGDTLAAAIRKSKPGVDAAVEVDRARAEARADLAQLD
jgi:hypothetical protein